MRRRGFSLIEVAIVLILVGLMGTAITQSYRSCNAFFVSASLQAQRRLDTSRAALRIFTAGQGGTILADQSGMDLADGGQLRWRDGKVWLRGHSLLSQPVRDFTLIRRDGRLHVTFVLEAPRVYHGLNRTLRYQYSQGMGRKPL